MTLHPDILTDLVILYHAGEASQASRELLEKEAMQNPALAAALAARPRVIPPIETLPMIPEEEVLKRVRRHYLYRAVLAVCIALALLIALAVLRSQRPSPGSPRVSGDAPQSNPKATPWTEAMISQPEQQGSRTGYEEKGVSHHPGHLRGAEFTRQLTLPVDPQLTHRFRRRGKSSLFSGATSGNIIT